MKKLGLILLLGGLVISTASVHAGYDEGKAAYDKRDYTTALQEWLPLAEQQNAAAQTRLGTMYARGEGVSQNYTHALKWYRKAAEQGQSVAQFNLGVIDLLRK
jgi:TPR repeat protein